MYGITSTAEQMFPGTAPGASSTQAVSITYVPNPPVAPVNLNNLSFGNNTGGSLFPGQGVNQVTKMATTSGITSLQPLISFESDVHQSPTSVVPEPGSYTYMLLGLGLSVVGIAGKWRKNRA